MPSRTTIRKLKMLAASNPLLDKKVGHFCHCYHEVSEYFNFDGKKHPPKCKP